MTTVYNPVLRGFNPDPSILRVGDDYYIATSTFEFHPGVRLHHSRDLAHWEVIGHALDEGFDLSGIPDSGGVWAPSLSFSEGRFWLAYSIVRSMDGDDKDIDNYLVTAPEITGPWSAPVHLGSRGFDFSFFHDTDGTHWLVGVQWDQRPGHPSFGGLVLEQYFPEECRTSGQTVLLYQEEGLVEGPNLYHIGDWYYLLIAAGGTGWNHGITLARSRHRDGPYERDEAPAVLTTRDAPGLPLQKAGHGELVQTPAGQWALVHLAARPTLHGGERFCILGRETCLQRVIFDERGWLRLAHGGHHPAEAVTFDGASGAEVVPSSAHWSDSFNGPDLDSRHWSTLRVALDAETADFSARPGWLRLRGGHSAASVFSQSMLLRRIEEHSAVVGTVVEAAPHTSRQAAGLILWYDRNGWIWFQVTWDPEHGRHLRVLSRDGQTVRSRAVPAPDGPVSLRADLDGPAVRFAFRGEEARWTPIEGSWPLWTLSDDHGGSLRFTGLFAGVRADDLDGHGWSADFEEFAVRVASGEAASALHGSAFA